MAAAELWKLPPTWQWVNLGEISEVVSKGTTPTTVGCSFTKIGIPFLRAEDISGGAINPLSVAFHIDLKTHNTTLARSQLRPGDLLITIAGTLGRAGYVPNIATSLNCNQAIAFIRLKSNLMDVKFAYFACQYNNLINSLVDVKKVATIGNLNLQQIQDFKIPLPPLSEQRRIVSMLEKADRLRRLRRYALELSGTYLQAVFLEMFGDPVMNPKGWELQTLGDVVHSAQDGPHVSPDYSETGVPFLSTRNIRPGQVIWEDLKFISREEAEKHWQKCKPQWGDILYTKGGTTGLAKAIDFDREVAVWVHIALLKPNNKLVDSLWLESMLNSAFCYNQSQELTHGIANHDLGLTRMIKIKLYLPPLSLQREFARIAKKYTQLLAQQKEAERQAEHLFQTLLHKAFQGDLDEAGRLSPNVEIVNQQTSSFVDIAEPINTDAYQLALPLE